MCGDDSVAPVIVSRVELKTKLPVIALVHDISESSAILLRSYNFTVVKKAQVEYPFRVSASAALDRKSCRYSKLNLWTLPFDLVLYLDYDMLPLRNIDSVFDMGRRKGFVLGAVPDKYPYIRNTGLLLLRPNNRTFARMKSRVATLDSYNHGDQGFLNAFFHKKVWTNIPASYNVPLWLTKTVFNLRSVNVLHFTGEIKPWTVYKRHHPKFQEMFNAVAFAKWHLAYDTIFQSNTSDECHTYTEEKLNTQQATIVISTWQGKRISLLKLCRYYLSSPHIAAAIVVWHDPNSVPVNLTLPHTTIFHPSTDSLNNRFLPFNYINTETVISADDDVQVPLSGIRDLVTAHQEQAPRLVAVFVRYHSGGEYLFEDNLIDRNSGAGPYRKYSIALTKVLVSSRRDFYIYSCLQPSEVHAFVDKHLNCEDIAFNFAHTTVYKKNPIMLDIPVRDFGTDVGAGGISTKRKHGTIRSDCIKFFSNVYPTLPLNARLSLRRYSKTRYDKMPCCDFEGTWD